MRSATVEPGGNSWTTICRQTRSKCWQRCVKRLCLVKTLQVRFRVHQFQLVQNMGT
jgi:hypothetical protein